MVSHDEPTSGGVDAALPLFLVQSFEDCTKADAICTFSCLIWVFKATSRQGHIDYCSFRLVRANA